ILAASGWASEQPTEPKTAKINIPRRSLAGSSVRIRNTIKTHCFNRRQRYDGRACTWQSTLAPSVQILISTRCPGSLETNG
ncbi:MAG: hypothetical protein OEM62_09740, partial [Acidobacteriota bacterium]|nr:hypothetical protein [Acidobacteriota bacterium]